MTRKSKIIYVTMALAIASAVYAAPITQTSRSGVGTLTVDSASSIQIDGDLDINSGGDLDVENGGDIALADGGNIQIEGYDASVTGISYTLVSADATANGVTLTTGLASIWTANCQVVTSGNLVATSDAKIQWSSGSLSILDGSTYNTTSGQKIRCFVFGSN